MYIKKIKNLVYGNCLLSILQLNISIIFFFLISCIIHVVLIILLLYMYTQSSIIAIPTYLDKKKINTYSFLLVNSISDEVLKEKKILESNKIQHELEPILNKKINVVKKSKKAISFTNQHTFNNQINNSNNSNANIVHNDKKNSKLLLNIIHRVYPDYPIRAKILGVEGTVVVKYDINHMGKVVNIRIITANPVGIFEESIQKSMRCWKYTLDNPMQNLTIIFSFRLNTIKIHEH